MVVLPLNLYYYKRRIGKLIKGGQENGEIASQTNGYTGNQWGVIGNDTPKKTLSEIGIARNESSAFQQIAEIPEETFENVIVETKDAVRQNVIAEIKLRNERKLGILIKEGQEKG